MTSLLDGCAPVGYRAAVMSGHVINFRLRPPKRMFFLAFLILAVGGGIAAYYLSPARRFMPDARARAYFAIAIASVSSGCILIVATAKLWFRHLWHKRRH
ncbi:MAG: hypothetical protein FJ221_17850 [Lentisphaerae bacterium]|nr:hypothetical protein [Lentisphaerota bacterium]